MEANVFEPALFLFCNSRRRILKALYSRPDEGYDRGYCRSGTLKPQRSQSDHGASASYDWEKLLAHAAILQAKVPCAILVGGTAAALHAGHRISFDRDHVLKDLVTHYDKAMPRSSQEDRRRWNLVGTY